MDGEFHGHVRGSKSGEVYAPLGWGDYFDNATFAAPRLYPLHIFFKVLELLIGGLEDWDASGGKRILIWTDDFAFADLVGRIVSTGIEESWLGWELGLSGRCW